MRKGNECINAGSHGLHLVKDDYEGSPIWQWQWAQWFDSVNSTRTPPVDFGWTNAMYLPPAPSRGVSSIITTPFAIKWPISPCKSLTRKQTCWTPGPRLSRNFPIGVSGPVGSNNSIIGGWSCFPCGTDVEKNRVVTP